MVDRTQLDDEVFAKRTMAKVTGRLLPLAITLYFVSYIDRANLSVAALTMNRDLGLTPAVFGLGGAFFFVGYFLLQIPGNLALDRWGARRVISVVTLFWGVCAMGMALVQGKPSFYSTRFLLGLAEAPLFPGMILYIGMWFPAQWRGRIIALFMMASPLSNVVGLPISAVLLHLDGELGLRGWQWLFLVEGLPAVLLSGVVFLGGFFSHRLWIYALALFVTGWILQFVGHAFEGKPPEFLSDWRFLFVGVRWWWAKINGKA